MVEVVVYFWLGGKNLFIHEYKGVEEKVVDGSARAETPRVENMRPQEDDLAKYLVSQATI